MAIPMDRTKRAIEPFRLALMTARQGEVSWHPYSRPSLSGLHGLALHGLGDVWSNLGDAIIQQGGNWLDNKLQSMSIGGNDIIGIQNQVGLAMDELSAQYYPLRDSGTVTVAIIGQFQQAFQILIDSFCTYCRRIGTTRALAGCETITYWGEKWIADREAEKALAGGGGTGGGPGCVINPVTGQCITFTNPPVPGTMSTIGSYMPILLGAVFIFAMFKSSKKW